MLQKCTVSRIVASSAKIFKKKKDTVLERLTQTPKEEDVPLWEDALKVWRHYKTTSEARLSLSGEEGVGPESEPRPSLTFRVTCTRSGRKHCFTSTDAAARLGAGLVGRYGWKVQMKNADLEVLLAVSGEGEREREREIYGCHCV